MSPELNPQSLRELEILEHNLHHFSMQKQTIQLEMNEVINALNELETAHDEVYRVISNIMVRADKPSLRKELEERKRLLSLRLDALDKQEKLMESKVQEIRRQT